MKPGGPLRRTPLAPMSPKRLAKLGGWALSTFAPRGKGLRSSARGTAGGAASEGWLSRPPASGHRVDPRSAAVVRERSGGRCEIGIEGCWGDAREKSHRIAKGAGGRHGAARDESDRPSNLLDACVFCHLTITRHAWEVDAKRHGWVLKDRQDPARCEVYRRGRWVFLDDAGGVHSYMEAGA